MYHATEPPAWIQTPEQESKLETIAGGGWQNTYIVQPYPKMMFGDRKSVV